MKIDGHHLTIKRQSYLELVMNHHTPRYIVYGSSASPPTWGHADLMMRAAVKFDKLFWVAAVNPQKPKQYFTVDERLYMMSAYVQYYGLKNVEVLSNQGAIVRLAKKLNAQFLLRGLRNTTDFQMELELAAGNRGIDKTIETLCLFAKPHYATISSTLVRELALLGEKIDQYVLPSLVPYIVQRLNPRPSSSPS